MQTSQPPPCSYSPPAFLDLPLSLYLCPSCGCQPHTPSVPFPQPSQLSLALAPTSRIPCLPPAALPLNCYHPCTCLTSGLHNTAPKQYKKGTCACWQFSACTPFKSSTIALCVSLARTLLFSAAKQHRTTNLMSTLTCSNKDLIEKLHMQEVNSSPGDLTGAHNAQF